MYGSKQSLSTFSFQLFTAVVGRLFDLRTGSYVIRTYFLVYYRILIITVLYYFLDFLMQDKEENNGERSIQNNLLNRAKEKKVNLFLYCVGK